MRRINIHLTEKQIGKLKTVSKDNGLTVAELIRRAIDGYLNRKNKRNKENQ